MTIEAESFLYEFDAGTGVATVTLNRPERLGPRQNSEYKPEHRCRPA